MADYPTRGECRSDLSADAIRPALTTRRFGHPVYYWPVVGSTNDELKRLAGEGAAEGALAIADEQLSGRGRLDRRWIALAGSSLLASLLFRPLFLPPEQAQQVTMLCALAAADAVAQVAGRPASLKWPNDLLLDNKKLAGILTELDLAGDQLAWVVVGLGLNVNADLARPPADPIDPDWPELVDTAISLSMATGHPVSRLALLADYLSGVEARYELLREGIGPLEEWTARLSTVGQPVTVAAPDGVYQGVAEGVDERGALLLRRPDGQVTPILSGDVTLRVR